MFGSQILEVAIGIVFVYLILSLICSALNELVARMSALRSRTLEDGIRNLLDGKSQDGRELADIFYGHHLIKGLYKQGWIDKLIGRKGRPSYIPSRTFALTLFDMFAATKSDTDPLALSHIQDAISHLPDSDARNTLLLLIDESKGNLKKAQENVEQWFNDTMDRVCGWYKRNIQLITLCIAFVVSVGLNADTFIIVNSFYRDPTVRALVVAAASKQAPPTVPELSPKQILQIQEELQQLQLPMGWSKSNLRPSNCIRGWITKFFGLLFTTFAVSLGAPFWFDLLSEFMNLRSTGKQPEKTPEK
jgi:hypothetical protein